MGNSYITLGALNELSMLVKEKSQGKLDLDSFYLFTDGRFDLYNAIYFSKCIFISFKEGDCFIVIAEFASGRYLLKDSCNIISFNHRGYKDHDDYLCDISEFTKIGMNTLRIIERCSSDER